MTRSQIEVVRRFRAMNTDVEAVVVTGAPRATAATETLERAECLFHRTEATLSRFLPDSELCALNASAGRRFVASPVLFTAVAAAIDAAAATGGLFDPTILPALVAAGYDRSFELLPDGRPCQPVAPVRRSTWSEIALDPATRSILIRPGSALDLGGIGKGFTLDSAAHLLGQYKNFAIDAGGDMIVSGTQPDGSPWG